MARSTVRAAPSQVDAVPPRALQGRNVYGNRRTDAKKGADQGGCDFETFQSTPIAGAVEGAAS
ncbi:hypothetical protein [Synechococcus sp. BIOS-E4-1]|uniref:hypothetical protein n=1 Tax=Synechococcus sp. BIOS-E4-1 TaxID=1400864 RepID=UPI0021020F06|nr:hypothetical protein [Synechococcus sp. BIOS-E4-1]